MMDRDTSCATIFTHVLADHLKTALPWQYMHRRGAPDVLVRKQDPGCTADCPQSCGLLIIVRLFIKADL